MTLERAGSALIWRLGPNGIGGEVRVNLSADGAATDVRLTTAIKPDPHGGAVTASRFYGDMAEDNQLEVERKARASRPAPVRDPPKPADATTPATDLSQFN